MSHQDAADGVLAWLIRLTLTTELEDLQDSILPAITAALVPIHSMLGKPHNILAMGRAVLMRVPVSEANDLSHLLGNTLTLDMV